MVYSLLYVSKTLLELPAAEAEVAKIVEVANSRNGKLGVTGALVSSGSHFAQVLEGDQQAGEELMRSINDGARHMRIRIIRTAEEPRRFPGWSMAYSGFASFVGPASRHSIPLCRRAIRRIWRCG